jgi:acetyl esterase/lipase
VAVSVEHRLAPEHPHPAPVEDCYTGLAWTGKHTDELGIDGSRLLIAGGSAGGGLAGGTPQQVEISETSIAVSSSHAVAHRSPVNAGEQISLPSRSALLVLSQTDPPR